MSIDCSRTVKSPIGRIRDYRLWREQFQQDLKEVFWISNPSEFILRNPEAQSTFQAYKSIRCWIYQSCERPDCNENKYYCAVSILSDSLENFIGMDGDRIRKSAQWDHAMWDEWTINCPEILIRLKMMLDNKHNVKTCYSTSFYFFLFTLFRNLFTFAYQTISSTIKNIIELCQQL